MGLLLASTPMLRRLLTAAAAALCLLLPASSALASGAAVLVDCSDHGHLTKIYAQKDYKQALAQMPADLKQYTDCENIIRRAQRGVPGSTGGQATAQNPFAGTATAEVARAQRDIAVARTSGGAEQSIGGALVTPGALSYRHVSAITKLPTPLLVLIVLILLATAGFAVHVIRSRSGRPGEPGA